MSCDNANDKDGINYGCIFCSVGYELETARLLEEIWEDTTVRAATVIKRRSCKGIKRTETEVMLKGYVFFRTHNDAVLPFMPMPQHVHKLLKSSEGDWRLAGRDRQFADWLLRYNGEIGFSQARKVGDRVQMVNGPLKDMEGSIIKIDKRNQSGCVELVINNRSIKVWLGFELLADNSFICRR